MKPIAETVESMFASRSIQEDEYLNENDGLIYCSKCHTPRQHKIQWQDKVMLPTVRCQCQQEEYKTGNRTQASGVFGAGIQIESKRSAGQSTEGIHLFQ